MPKIEVLPDNILVESDNDKTILESVTEQGIPQVNACGANQFFEFQAFKLP